MNQEEYKLLYHDIINGYSFYNDDKEYFYIKHFKLEDLNDVNKKKIQIENKARKLGLLSEEEQLKNLIEKDNWSEDKESEILKLKSFIKDLKYTKSKLITTRDIENVNSQIKENQDKLNKISKEREEVLGTTLESYSNKKITEYYIFLSLFKDDKLKEKFFTKDQFDELEYKDLFEYYLKYNHGLSGLIEKNIKKIALSSFFLNGFYLCEDSPLIFFGKPVVELTFSQVELFAYGKYFKNILTNSTTKPPDNIADDPEALVDWYEGSKNANKNINKNNSNKEILGSSIVGASKKDLKKLGIDKPGGIDLVKEAEKKGGSLSFQDLIKLHNA